MKKIKYRVTPVFDGPVFAGVKISRPGGALVIPPQDIDDKERRWGEAMALLEKRGERTFAREEVEIIAPLRKEINHILETNGGKPLSRWYWTASENEWGDAYYYQGFFGLTDNCDKIFPKYCRAVRQIGDGIVPRRKETWWTRLVDKIRRKLKPKPRLICYDCR